MYLGEMMFMSMVKSGVGNKPRLPDQGGGDRSVHTWLILLVSLTGLYLILQPGCGRAQNVIAGLPAEVKAASLNGAKADGSGRPLSLKSCLNQAVTSNPLLAEARLGVQADEKSVDSAKGRHYPKLSLDGNYTKREDPWPYIPAQSATILPHFSDEFASWQVLLALPVYQGGQIVNGVELARVRKTISEQQLKLTKNDIIANVVNTYNKILQLQKFREASRSSIDALENQLKSAKLLFAVGRTAKVDLLKVEVQLANEKQRLLSLDEAMETSVETLQFLMGGPSKGSPAVLLLSDSLTMPDFTPDADRSMETAKKNKPEYLLAEKGVEEARASRKIFKGKLLPTLGVFAGYLDQYGFSPWYGEANWFTGVNISMTLFEKPLYDGLARERILEEKAGKRLRAVENQVRLDIQSALSSMKESKNRVLAAGKVVEQAEESFRIEEVRYRNGGGAVVDMLLAQAAYVTSVANYTQSLFDYNAAIVAYRKATGTLEDYLR